MAAINGVLLCLAYCTGLFVVSLLIQHLGLEPLWGSFVGGLSLLAWSILAAVWLPRRWPTGPRSLLYLLAGLLSLLAAFNYCWQWPVPAANDISRLLSADPTAEQLVWGTVQDMPTKTRSDRGRFWLKVNQVRQIDAQGQPLGPPQAVVGKLYVTSAWERAKALYPGQALELSGRLYAPSPAKNPNSFDFKAYLASQNSFAGFAASRLSPQTRTSPPRWRLWQLRRRIATAQLNGLGTPAGPLVSAMALGRRAVNLPYEIQDTFMQAGLSHVLAASGFQVSLMLGVLMALLKHQPVGLKVGAGAAALLLFIGLAGADPSVMRAALMGAGVLVALALERQIKPLGCLLLAVTLLLIWQPLWIDSIGFRLSVMATLGLMVTATPLTERLNWLPGSIAALVAVPVAAYLWTIPLQLYYFNTLSFYSIGLNILTTPLVTLLSLGGMGSAAVAALLPPLGTMLSSLLYFPTHLLIAVVNWEVGLPGNSMATGQISLVQMLGLYGLLSLAWLQPWWRRRRWAAGIAACTLAFAPLIHQSSTVVQVTVLAAGSDSVLVAQQLRSTLLINSGEPKTAFYTVAPFLRQAGVNQLDWAVALPQNTPEAWGTLVQNTPVQTLLSLNGSRPSPTGIRTLLPLAAGTSQPSGPATIQRFGVDHPILRLILAEEQAWLMLPRLTLELQRFVAQGSAQLASDVLWWDGSPLADELLAQVQPKVAIASAPSLPATTRAQLTARGIQVFVTEQDGAVIWTPKQGFWAYLQRPQRRQSELGG